MEWIKGGRKGWQLVLDKYLYVDLLSKIIFIYIYIYHNVHEISTNLIQKSGQKTCSYSSMAPGSAETFARLGANKCRLRPTSSSANPIQAGLARNASFLLLVRWLQKADHERRSTPLQRREVSQTRMYRTCHPCTSTGLLLRLRSMIRKRCDKMLLSESKHKVMHAGQDSKYN